VLHDWRPCDRDLRDEHRKRHADDPLSRLVASVSAVDYETPAADEARSSRRSASRRPLRPDASGRPGTDLRHTRASSRAEACRIHIRGLALCSWIPSSPRPCSAAGVPPSAPHRCRRQSHSYTDTKVPPAAQIHSIATPFRRAPPTSRRVLGSRCTTAFDQPTKLVTELVAGRAQRIGGLSFACGRVERE
jgi:hypothetical protein